MPIEIRDTIAACRDGEVVGFASYGPFRAWPGYRYMVENSVYLASMRAARASVRSCSMR